jgi:hypothetical protein
MMIKIREDGAIALGKTTGKNVFFDFKAWFKLKSDGSTSDS